MAPRTQPERNRTANALVEIHFEQLAHEIEATVGLVKHHLEQAHNVRVRVEPPQRLHLPQAVDLLEAVELAFHPAGANRAVCTNGGDGF